MISFVVVTFKSTLVQFLGHATQYLLLSQNFILNLQFNDAETEGKEPFEETIDKIASKSGKEEESQSGNSAENKPPLQHGKTRKKKRKF